MSRKIYIKKNPSKRKMTKEEAERLITMCTFNYEELDTLFKDNESFYTDFFNNLSKIIDEPDFIVTEDWTGCESFWTSKETEEGIVMIEHSLKGNGIEKIYNSNEELEKEFICLNKFIEMGNYIGRYFRRTQLTCENDRQYLPVNHSVFVLYDNDGVLLSVKQDENKIFFIVIEKRYTEDGKYEFYGCKKNSFNQKKEINKAIVKQLKK